MARNELKVKISADDGDLQRGLDRSQKSINGFSKAIKGMGIALAGVFAAETITRALKDIIKTASDAQETFSKFEVVFSAVAKSADVAFKDLRENYGLSSKAAKQLLSDTGDLLTGFGFSQQAALDLSTRVSKLAVDLASFTNFAGGAAGASQALTKALLGERGSVKALGISILEEDVKKQVAINTAKGLIFETERQAKAYATLDIALSQSKNALGDYARTSDSFANTSKTLNERLDDLKVIIGTAILPLVTKLTEKFVELAEKAIGFFSLETKEDRIAAAMERITATADELREAEIEKIWNVTSDALSLYFRELQRLESKKTLVPFTEAWNDNRNAIKAAKKEIELLWELQKAIAFPATVLAEIRERELRAAESIVDANEKAARQAREMEELRRKGLGDIGRLQEDLANAEAKFIAANSDAWREYYALLAADIREKLKLLSQEAVLQEAINKFLAERKGLEIGIPGISEAPQRMPSQSGALPIETGGLEAYNRALNESIVLQNIAQFSAEKWADTMRTVQMIAEDAAYSIGEAFGQMAASGGRATQQLVSQAIAQAIAAIIRQLATTLPFPANIAAIAGAGMFSGLMRSQIPAFADGGVAFGPTLGLMGEYANARTNPEVIAPLDKLQSMIGGGTGEVEFRIKGQELWGVLKKYENRLNQNA